MYKYIYTYPNPLQLQVPSNPLQLTNYCVYGLPCKVPAHIDLRRASVADGTPTNLQVWSHKPWEVDGFRCRCSDIVISMDGRKQRWSNSFIISASWNTTLSFQGYFSSGIGLDQLNLSAETQKVSTLYANIHAQMYTAYCTCKSPWVYCTPVYIYIHYISSTIINNLYNIWNKLCISIYIHLSYKHSMLQFLDFNPSNDVPSNRSELSAILHHGMEEAKAKEQRFEGLLGAI